MKKFRINNFDKITQQLTSISDNMKKDVEKYTVEDGKNSIEVTFQKCIGDTLEVYIRYASSNQAIGIALKNPMAYIYNGPIHLNEDRFQSTIDYVISKLEEDILIGDYFN